MGYINIKEKSGHNNNRTNKYPDKEKLIDSNLLDLIHLIDIDENTTLFFHANTLQIYPLKTDDEICDFLRKINKYGYNKTKEFYSQEDFNLLYNFIVNQILSAPKTMVIKDKSIEKQSFSSIVIPISGKCNLKCPYCFARVGNDYHFKDYTTKDIDSLLDFLVKKNKNSKESINIAFFGGEPFMNFNIMEYTINRFKKVYPKQKVTYSVTTNGTILNKKIITFLKKNNIAVLLSMDGPDNDFNFRKFKNGKSSVSCVLKNLNLLKENNIFVELRATMVNNNPFIVETFDFFESLNCPFNIVFAYYSENKSYNKEIIHDKGNLNLIKTQLSDLLAYYIVKLQEQKNIFSKIIPNITNTIKYRIKQETACSAGRSFFTITANGEIFSCSHFMNDNKYKIGNINTDSINKSYSPINVDNIDDCKNCWAKYLCNGGCVAQKISMGKNIDSAKTPEECELEKILWEFYLKMYYYTKQYQNI